MVPFCRRLATISLGQPRGFRRGIRSTPSHLLRALVLRCAGHAGERYPDATSAGATLVSNLFGVPAANKFLDRPCSGKPLRWVRRNKPPLFRHAFRAANSREECVTHAPYYDDEPHAPDPTRDGLQDACEFTRDAACPRLALSAPINCNQEKSIPLSYCSPIMSRCLV
jgi:hypothetical protein